MAQRLVGYAVGMALVAALVLAAPAAAQQLAPTTEPLPGSTFQGADGNQDDAGELIDWQTLQADGRVRHSPDPSADDSAFADGSKETQPGNWALTTESGGVSPDKDNILDAWSTVDQTGGDTFLYLGFTRQQAGGTTFLSFELNHDDRLWNNGRANIPCRRTGDVQISYEPSGNTVVVAIRRWRTTATDQATGCAESGEFVSAGVQENVDAQAAINEGAIVSRLPGSLTATVGAGQFGEAALDLTRLLEEAFGEECMAFSSLWMHSRASDSISSNLQDYVAPRRLFVETCTASGTKFFDSNANGQRDPGEPGIPRFMIWADYDNDGVRDDNEPFSVSDSTGRYVIHDIRPPNGTYRLRERLLRRRSRALPVAGDWRCSFPNDSTAGGTGSATGGRFPCAWDPINVDTNPNAEGRDFGNWFPARLIVEKRLFPATDPGRFDLFIGDEPVVAAAGDRMTAARSLPPGTYTVSERPAAGTDPAAYRTTVWCRGARLLAGPRFGAASAEVSLSAGQAVRCTFYNARPGTPAIATAKHGPEVAVAGDTLRYRLVVTNPGDVPFRASAVRVADPRCDEPPELVSKSDDPTPGTLDPGDEWIYRCTTATSSGGEDCEPTRIPNTETVTGTAADGTTVEDQDEISTILLCPDDPVPPIPPTPGPGPGPVVPPGPTPPDADAAGTAGLIFRRTIQGCIGRRVPRVNLRGVRIASVRIYVNDRFIRRLTLGVLQRAHRPRVTLAPGRRYRIRVRVTFQRGTDSPAVAFAGSFRTCARPPVACPSAASEPGARVACASTARRRD